MTASLPVFINKNFIGVVAIDAAVDDIINNINQRQLNEMSYFMIADETGKVCIAFSIADFC